MRQYYIRGNTYPFKEELKANGCKWDSISKTWLTPLLDKGSTRFKMLSSLCLAHDAEILPRKLKKECALIQNILNKQ